MNCDHCHRPYGISDFGPWVGSPVHGVVQYAYDRSYNYARGLCICCWIWHKGPFVSGAPKRADDECRGN